MYSNATFQPNEKFNSGIRSDSGITSVLPASRNPVYGAIHNKKQY